MIVLKLFNKHPFQFSRIIFIIVVVSQVLMPIAFTLPFPLSKQVGLTGFNSKVNETFRNSDLHNNNDEIEINSVAEWTGSPVEKQFKKLMLKALNIDSQISSHFNQRPNAIPPLMLKLWEFEQSRHLLQRGDIDLDNTILEDFGEDLNGTEAIYRFQNTWLYNFIHSKESGVRQDLDDNITNDLLKSSQTISDSTYITTTGPIIDSVIASLPVSILNDNKTKIDIEYHLKGEQLKILLWVELVLHRKLKIKHLNQQAPSTQILVCITLKGHNATTIEEAPCITHSALEPIDEFIHLNISLDTLRNYSQFPIVKISISVSELSDTSIKPPNSYVMEITSKYAPFLLLYKNSAKARYTGPTSPKLGKVRSKRRVIPSNESMCQLHEWYIDFSTLGWSDWFVKPNGYFINFCGGRCASPLLNENYNASMHSLIKDLWILATKGKGKPINSAGDISFIPKASCVPIEYESLSVLYIEDSNIVLKHLDGMSASRCGCR